MADRRNVHLMAQQRAIPDSKLCQCCGQLRPDVIHVDLNAHTVSRGVKTVKVRPTGAELMAIMVRFRPGSLVPYERIYSGIWGAVFVEGGRKTQNHISVQVLHLRRQIEPLGLGLTMVRGLGMRLDIEGGNNG